MAKRKPSTRVCEVARCIKPVLARGLCGTHYARWRRGGDPHELSLREMTYEQRILDCVDAEGDCWEWTGRLSQYGYGRAWDGEHALQAHRAVWLLLVGEIPDGLDLDHLCRNRACCNPDHLEPVTPRENTLRGYTPAARNAAKTHCKHGHEFTLENTYLRSDGRVCRTCQAGYDDKRRR